MELNEIEHKIACGEMSAAQVFTQMKQHIPPPVEREYYYRVSGCKAKDPRDPGCICWHAEGVLPTGVGKERLTWRDAERSQQSAKSQ